MNTILQKRIVEAAKKMSHDKTAFWEDCDYSIKDIEEIIYDACKLTAVHALQNQWISVKEELPKEDDYYLCKYYDDDDGLVFFEDVMYFSKEKMFDTIDNDRITHWMPIPSLKGGEE